MQTLLGTKLTIPLPGLQIAAYPQTTKYWRMLTSSVLAQLHWNRRMYSPALQSTHWHSLGFNTTVDNFLPDSKSD